MDEEKRERCFPFGRCGKKAIIDALTIGFISGAAATVGLIKLIESLNQKK